MKFVCDNCGTKYHIADEKVRRKILKIRCKTCSNVITVHESKPGATASSPSLPAARGPQASAPRGSAAAAPGAGARAPLRPTGSLVAPQAAAARPPVPLNVPAEEWHLTVDGQCSGPFGRLEVVRRIKGASREAEVYVWREDFDGWKEPKDVPVLAKELQAPRSGDALAAAPPARPGAAPLPSARPEKEAEREDTDELAISDLEEVPQPKKAPALPSAFGAPLRPALSDSPPAGKPVSGGPPAKPPAEAPAAAPSPQPPKPAAAGGGPSLPPPGGGRPLVFQRKPPASLPPAPVAAAPVSPEAQPPPSSPGAPPAVPSQPAHDQNGAVSASAEHSAAKVVPIPEPFPMFGSLPAASVPTNGAFAHGPVSVVPHADVPSASYPLLGQLKKMKYALGGLGLILLVSGVFIIYLLMRPPELKQVMVREAEKSRMPEDLGAEAAERLARAEAERRFGMTVGSSVTVGPDAKPEQPQRRPTSSSRGGSGHAKATPASLTPAQEAMVKRFAAPTTAAAPAPAAVKTSAATRPGIVPQEAISRVVRSNQAAIKVCYERALKRDQSLTHGRIDVTVAIGTSGRVKKVDVVAPSAFREMDPCIKQAVSRWVFPAAPEEYGTTFPYLLQGSH